jgi:hypothetical protein
MADDESRPRDGMSAAVQDFVAQLRGVTERLAGLAGVAEGLPSASALRSLPGLPTLPPPPGALSAAQLKAVSTAVAAQRAGIASMQAQLQAFDEQLAVLEQILGPLTEWSATWADLERGLMNLRPGSNR